MQVSRLNGFYSRGYDEEWYKLYIKIKSIIFNAFYFDRVWNEDKHVNKWIFSVFEIMIFL
jgi:hypothetical protein